MTDAFIGLGVAFVFSLPSIAFQVVNRQQHFVVVVTPHMSLEHLRANNLVWFTHRWRYWVAFVAGFAAIAVGVSTINHRPISAHILMASVGCGVFWAGADWLRGRLYPLHRLFKPCPTCKHPGQRAKERLTWSTRATAKVAAQ